MAGLGRRTFQAGEVLTASNVMAYLQDQAVMNFAGTAARGSAIGTAVSEGMVSYLADTNVVQAYDGSAWNSLAYASSVITPGIVPLIPSAVSVTGGSGSYNSTTGLVTFSGSSAVQIDGVFSSSYTNYKIEINSSGSSANMGLCMRMRSGGSDFSGNNYSQGIIYWGYPGTIAVTGATTNTEFQAGWVNASADSKNYSVVNLANPNLAAYTTFNGLGTSYVSNVSAGYLNTTTQYTGITVTSASSATFSGTIKIYGVK